MLSIVHLSSIIVTAFYYNETTLPYIDSIIYVAVPFKDGCIALLITRLYFYQGTSETRHVNIDIEE